MIVRDSDIAVFPPENSGRMEKRLQPLLFPSKGDLCLQTDFPEANPLSRLLQQRHKACGKGFCLFHGPAVVKDSLTGTAEQLVCTEYMGGQTASSSFDAHEVT